MSLQVGEGARVGPADLFIAFARLTFYSFGGALFWSHRMIVEQKRWMNDQQFVELLSLAQLLPGANGVNLAVMIGHHFAGVRGAAAAVAGFISAPMVVIVSIAILHERYGALPVVQDAIGGMSAVAIGLLIAMGAKLAVVVRGRWQPWAFVVLTFLAVGVMRWPLLAVLAVLAPFAIAAEWKGRR